MFSRIKEDLKTRPSRLQMYTYMDDDLPALKIVKIKKYIEELGGLRMTVMLLMGTASAKEKVATVAALAAEISGITDIHDNCF